MLLDNLALCDFPRALQVDLWVFLIIFGAFVHWFCGGHTPGPEFVTQLLNWYYPGSLFVNFDAFFVAFFNLVCYNGIDIYAAEKAKAIESTCQVSVVADQERIAKNWCGNSALGEKDAEGSPFKRS